MVDEILALGFDHLELGYDTRRDLLPGVRQRVNEGAVRVDSVHNFCPVPMSSPRGHPELYTLADRDPDIRRKAVHHTSETVRFASEIGARVVVAHAGNVSMGNMTRKLMALHESGRQYDPRYEKLKLKIQNRRDRKAPRQFDFLLQGLEELLPLLEELHVVLALEILPSWEAFPSEVEFERIFARFKSPFLGYWHDIGHAQIRENLGFTRAERWLERLSPHLAGLHLHDVQAPARDHVMPPRGDIDFAWYRPYALREDVLRVFEPTPRTPREHILEGLETLRNQWIETGTVPPRTGPEKQEHQV